MIDVPFRVKAIAQPAEHVMEGSAKSATTAERELCTKTLLYIKDASDLWCRRPASSMEAKKRRVRNSLELRLLY